MAKIVLNDVAPKDAKSFSLANENFKVPYETDDAVVLANAEAHPWLKVERESVEQVAGTYADRQVKPEDDPFSAHNSVANDPEAAKAALAAREDISATPLAVEAGIDQDKVKSVGKGDDKVSLTLAADDKANDDSKDKE